MLSEGGTKPIEVICVTEFYHDAEIRDIRDKLGNKIRNYQTEA